VQQVASGSTLEGSFPRPPEVIRARFARGSTCYVATVKGDFAGYIWLAQGIYEEDEVRCQYKLPPGHESVWDFDVYVEPRLRLGRTLGRLWRGVDAALGQQGVQWSISRIALSNAGSVQAHERLGAVYLASGAFLNLGPLQLSLFSKAPFARLSLGRAWRPVLALFPPPVTADQVRHVPKMRSAALVLGVDSHGLAVIRALADEGFPVYAVEKDLNLPGAASRRVRQIFHTPDFSETHLLPVLQSVRQQLSVYAKVVLFAINDRQVETIGKHLELLRPLYEISWADCAQTVLELQRKDSLEARSREQGLAYPRSLVFTNEAHAREASDFRYPVIIKPVRPLSSFKTLIARDVVELDQQLHSHAHDLPILGQEYIEGGDEQIFFGALILDRGKVIHGMAGRKIASYPPARGQTTIAETIDNAEVLRLTELFFHGQELSGPVSLELKLDPQGRYWVIEPTVGRTDFWVKLCISAGFNQPLMEYQLALGLTVTPPSTQQESVWYDTERDPLAYAALCWREKTLRPRVKHQTFPYLCAAEWQPFGWAFFKMLRTAFRRMSRLTR